MNNKRFECLVIPALIITAFFLDYESFWISKTAWVLNVFVIFSFTILFLDVILKCLIKYCKYWWKHIDNESGKKEA